MSDIPLWQKVEMEQARIARALESMDSLEEYMSWCKEWDKYPNENVVKRLKERDAADVAANYQRQQKSLRSAITHFRRALKDMKDSNDADQLNTGLVLDSLNYEEMILHLIKGVQIILDSFDEEDSKCQ